MSKNDKDSDPECDIVMKGGITSGIVYPKALCELANQYNFRNVGGTSAGAIAAVLAAAAQYGKNRGHDGFAVLDERTQELQKVIPGKGPYSGKDVSKLQMLFQPAEKGRRLFHLVMDAMKLSSGKTDNSVDQATNSESALFKILAMVASLWSPGLTYTLIPIVIVPLLTLFTTSWGQIGAPTSLFLSFGIVASILLGVVLAAFAVGLVLWKDLKINFTEDTGYGLCSGQAEAGYDEEALMQWLERSVNDCAGLDAEESEYSPLTFGDLWGDAYREEKEKAAKKGEPLSEEPKIDLKMVSTNLSLGQPFVFPLVDGSMFLFKKSDSLRFFGEQMTNYMSENAAVHKLEKQQGVKKTMTAPEGYFFFPEAERFPVLVAMRFSLSFPFLFSAIPAYAIAKGNAGLKENHLRRCWFSDGGISSNFPIHFFDSWLPTRPTFGVTLTSTAPGVFLSKPAISKREIRVALTESENSNRKQMSDEERKKKKERVKERNGKNRKDVHLPDTNDPVLHQLFEIDNPLNFFGSVLSAAKDYHDLTQSQLPSYRERIVQIKLDRDEGGMNLNMPKAKIDALMSKGKLAGQMLRDDFEFPAHQWTRFRLLLSEMEEMFRKLRGPMDKFKFEDLRCSSLEPDSNFEFLIESDDDWETIFSRIEEFKAVIGDTESGWKPGMGKVDTWPEPSMRIVPENL